ncbi:hypothetical protein C8R47DRAFT_294922 [Mycena vitilis]|nr:hypothetical protein C8R47DRAFT_294922 [Mycena vitilis]
MQSMRRSLFSLSVNKEFIPTFEQPQSEFERRSLSQKRRRERESKENKGKPKHLKPVNPNRSAAQRARRQRELASTIEGLLQSRERENIRSRAQTLRRRVEEGERRLDADPECDPTQALDRALDYDVPFSQSSGVVDVNAPNLDYGIEHDSTVHLVLRLRGGPPSSDAVPDEGRMGIAAGGKIEQKIYQDTNSPLVYDDENPYRVFIHTVSTAAWELITGVVCPVTPISPELYKAYNYPWFDLYDEHLSTVRPTGLLNAVRSISKLDNNAPLPPYAAIDPRVPPSCLRHAARKAICVARPCGHAPCPECFGESAGTGKCTVCKEGVDKYVGLGSLCRWQRRGEGVSAWWEAEALIEGVVSGSPAVVTLFLREDAVSSLHGVYPCNYSVDLVTGSLQLQI